MDIDLDTEIKIYRGNIIYTQVPHKFEIIERGYIVVDKGIIHSVSEQLPEQFQHCEIDDFGDYLIIPGFVDLHVHASQFANLGIALDMELLEWLNYYTYPEESRFKDLTYARKIYKAFSHELVMQGTTRAVVYGTIFNESNVILAEELERRGVYAYVGKVNMDQNCPGELCEETEKSLLQTEEFISFIGDFFTNIKPIITPRFVPACSDALLYGLGQLAEKYQVPIQSHLSESQDEVSFVKKNRLDSYANIYEKHGLLGKTPSLMAHCIYLDEHEFDLMKNPNVIAVHCPDSNMNLASGIMPLRKLMNHQINIALGTDVAGGHTLSMRDALVRAIQSSKILWTMDGTSASLSLSEAFFLATKGGGRLWGNVGSFEPGFQFDALVVRPDDVARMLKPEIQLQRFIYVGKPSDIILRYAAGKEIGYGQ